MSNPGYGSTELNRLISRETSPNLQQDEPTTNTPSFFENLKSLHLENKGTVARDHMANERTFLAWLRTSLSFISLGIGITQLFRLNKDSSPKALLDVTNYGKPLGSSFIVLGIVTLLFGFSRFFQVQSLLTKNYFPATRLFMFFLIGALVSLILVSFGLVLRAT